MTELELKDACIKFASEVVIRFGFPDEPNKEITQDVIDAVAKYYDTKEFDATKG
jgi:3-methyladenine DNA glycosylase AlkD